MWRLRQERQAWGSREKSIPTLFPVLRSPASLEPPNTTAPEPPNTTAPEPPHTTFSEAPDTTSPEPPDTTSQETVPQQGPTHSPRSPASTRTCRPAVSQAAPTQEEVIPTSSSNPASDQLSTALWIGSAVLGLLLLALPTYRLWKRCRHLAEDGAHPPASLRLLPQVSAWAGLRGTDQVGSSPS
ncbi:mucosal addressin cell adhesion molecule 1 [Sapajus apella]|uniref:Mucosal addressin cell adhesion molecule 1 n=1 Tax=Sapajus apella TaxID=9515 RepID=A0A6J3HDI9_SAPAP|nr:mucosal addressin cell adhesion molecule 1 [Sapajus apella]